MLRRLLSLFLALVILGGVLPAWAQDFYDAVAGTGYDLVPVGEPGQLSIVMTDTINEHNGSNFVVVLRNNTDNPLMLVEVGASITNASGELIGVAISGPSFPRYVQQGGLVLTTLTIDDKLAEIDHEIEFNVSSTPFTPRSEGSWRDLDVLETSLRDGEIFGTMTNHYDFPIGQILTYAVCLGPSDDPLIFMLGRTNKSTIAPGEDADFVASPGLSIDPSDCENHIVAASGWDD